MRVKKTLKTTIIAATIIAVGIPAYATDTDKRIESSFQKSFVYKTYLQDEHIKINSKDGLVTLSGDVLDENHKPMAEAIAEALPGVTKVDNRIEIKGERPVEKSDTWIRMKIQTTLVFHRNVNASKTEVYVKDGVVTLRGEANSQFQKDLTTEYAKDIDGVKSIDNELTIGKNQTLGEKIDDASVTAQVKTALMLNRSTSAIKTKVETNDGVVTLSGKAKNTTEKDLVSKLVEDVNGVKSVVNNMTTEL